jgi:hypothetical protein
LYDHDKIWSLIIIKSQRDLFLRDSTQKQSLTIKNRWTVQTTLTK